MLQLVQRRFQRTKPLQVVSNAEITKLACSMGNVMVVVVTVVGDQCVSVGHVYTQESSAWYQLFCHLQSC